MERKKLSDYLKKKIIDTSKPEYRDFPKSTEGEILLDIVKHPVTGVRLGYLTIHPDTLDEMFKEAVEEAIRTGRKLSECLLKADNIYDEKGRKIGEKGFKKYIHKWLEEGLIE